MQRRRLLLPLLLVSLLLVAFLAAAQPGRPDSPGGGRGGPMDGAHARMMHEEARWNNLTAAQREHGAQRAEQARLFGHLTLANGELDGRFVQASVEYGPFALTNYSLAGANATTTFFARVGADGWTPTEEPRVTGAVMRAFGDDAALAVHDNPTAMLQWVAANATEVTFELPAGANASGNDRALRVNVTGGHGHIVVHGNGTLAQEDGAIVASLLENASVQFVAHPTMEGVREKNLHAEVDAIARGRLGGELSLVDADGAPLAEHASYGVTMRADEVRAGRVRVNLSSESAEPKAVIVNLPVEVLNGTNGSALRVLLDGQPMERRDNATVVLAGNVAGYAADAAGGALEIVVGVPGFSDHELTIEPADGSTGTGGTGGNGDTDADGEGGSSRDATPGAGFALVALAALGAALLARRR